MAGHYIRVSYSSKKIWLATVASHAVTLSWASPTLSVSIMGTVPVQNLTYQTGGSDIAVNVSEDYLYIADLRIYGRRKVTTAGLYSCPYDSDSLAKYGRRRLHLTNILVTNQTEIDTLGQGLLEKLKAPRPTLRATFSNTRHAALLRSAEIGKTISVTTTGTSRKYAIAGIDYIYRRSEHLESTLFLVAVAGEDV